MKKADFEQIFSGALNLSNPLGTVYKTTVQSGALILSSGGNKAVNGWALAPITADGAAITPDPTWIKYGGDDISIAPGAVNHFMLTWSGEYYYYTNRVV